MVKVKNTTKVATPAEGVATIVTDNSKLNATLLKAHDALKLENAKLKTQLENKISEVNDMTKLLQSNFETIVLLETAAAEKNEELDRKAEKLEDKLPAFQTPAGQVRPLKKMARLNGIVYHFTESVAKEDSISFNDLLESKKIELLKEFPSLFTTEN